MSIYGLSEYGAEQAFLAANVLPSGTNKYVGLLTALPTDRDGTGLVEATGASYARVANLAWTTATVVNDTVRSNTSAVTFPTLTGALAGIVGWAIWSASVAGNLIAFGPLTDSSDLPVTRSFVNGDTPRFAAAELEIKIGAD